MDKHGSLSSTYHFTCHGRVGATRRFSVAAKSTQLELVRGKANRPVADVCQGGKIRVAYDPYALEVKDNKMVKYHVRWSAWDGIAYNYEILSTFLNANQLIPTYIDNNGSWIDGTWDEEAGQWTGMVALVRADIIILVD